MKKGLNEAEKKARIRDSKLEELINQAEVGLSADQQKTLLEILHKTTGDNYFIGKRKKKTDGVRFVQILMENYNYLSQIKYLSNAQKAFLLDLVPYVEFKTNILIERPEEDLEEVSENSASPSYLAKKLGRERAKVSKMMNELMKLGILAVAETGMTTEDGRVCTSRTWFVNPNIMCCSARDDVDKATQRIFKRSLKNFKVEGSSKKHNLPIYLF